MWSNGLEETAYAYIAYIAVITSFRLFEWSICMHLLGNVTYYSVGMEDVSPFDGQMVIVRSHGTV